MFYPTVYLPAIIEAIEQSINAHADEITLLDQTLGDGDHVSNLQRGIAALKAHSSEYPPLDWSGAWQKIGMTLMTQVGGASGSLLGTLFIALAKAGRGQELDLAQFARIFEQAVIAVKQRGKSDVGEKTMLDVLVPISDYLKEAAAQSKDFTQLWPELVAVAEQGVESTRTMRATKGRASYLGERSLGHIDAGAKTTQLIINAIVRILSTTDD
ncbi:dihydroxyacetone kinase subunit DhaL [Methylocucumis oryzae]|uniref:Dihydroxyacetone kinase n=1 Tax=Methylocucumis oryzae TaxID=1632867 RepID=A0A0F3IIA7_9GAMM|nr:dihydroxyacetone kinase subunit DhaL [Methylocucumis oryzae]KJV06535.1 dihydroxyacetone kinase [Methylocucumis oryzae]